MAGVRGWLLSVLAASLICALADGLMPRGAVKRVGRLVCGLVLLTAVLSPVVQLDLGGAGRWTEDYFAQLELQEQELKEQVDVGMKAVIEQRCAAYIVDKAAQRGLECTVRVECRTEEEGLYVPDRGEIRGALTQEDRTELSRILEEDLGIPAERQSFMDEEGAP